MIIIKNLGKFYQVCSLGDNISYCYIGSLSYCFIINSEKKLMIIGSICENKVTEKRISVTPDNVKSLLQMVLKFTLKKTMVIILT